MELETHIHIIIITYLVDFRFLFKINGNFEALKIIFLANFTLISLEIIFLYEIL